MNEEGKLFCYLGCSLGGNPTRLDLLTHLAWEHRDHGTELNFLGLRWLYVARQCEELFRQTERRVKSKLDRRHRD